MLTNSLTISAVFFPSFVRRGEGEVEGLSGGRIAQSCSSGGSRASTTLPHPCFRRGKPSSASPYKGEGTREEGPRGAPPPSQAFCQRMSEHIQGLRVV